jgi:hypothetical protein
MAHYLVSARPKGDRIADLEARLARDEFVDLRPFGHALTLSLDGARLRENGTAVWDEEDYCRPPLAEERAAVLDAYFDGIAVEAVNRDAGWARIADLPRLFPRLGDHSP